MVKALSIRDTPSIENAHAVRRLCLCEKCHGLGDRAAMLFGKEHQACFVQRHRGRLIKAVLALPREESDKLMLSVIGSRAMRALLNRGRQ